MNWMFKNIFFSSYTIKDPIVSERLDKTDAYSNERELFLNQLPGCNIKTSI
jgi:hypothetical protein